MPIPDHAKQDRTTIDVLPSSRDELFRQFDLIIFGDIDPHHPKLGEKQLQSMADFVKEKGGGLLFIAGPQFSPTAFRDTPLADVLPVEPRSRNPIRTTLDSRVPFRLLTARADASLVSARSGRSRQSERLGAHDAALLVERKSESEAGGRDARGLSIQPRGCAGHRWSRRWRYSNSSALVGFFTLGSTNHGDGGCGTTSVSINSSGCKP